jgi:fatty-acyl-CoA synthase
MYPAMGRDTVLLVTSPTFNTAGINELVIPTLLVGGTVTIHPSRGWTPEAMADLIGRWGVTHCIIYPSMMEPLLEADRAGMLPLGSLRFVLTGGENCPPATMVRFQDRWPHLTLGLGYGSTESGVVTLITDGEIRRHPGSVGRVALGMAMRIHDTDGQAVAPGEVGEIWAGGGSIVPGYWDAPDLTDATVRDGWINMGDLGRQDADGYLYLEGRSKDLIISKGQNIYPAEVENVLREHDALFDSAVVGLPDPEWGEVVCAALVVKPDRDVTEQDIVAFVQQRLASYKKPRHVVFLDELPRNPGNKVIKPQLAELVARALERRVD